MKQRNNNNNNSHTDNMTRPSPNHISDYMCTMANRKNFFSTARKCQYCRKSFREKCHESTCLDNPYYKSQSKSRDYNKKYHPTIDNDCPEDMVSLWNSFNAYKSRSFHQKRHVPLKEEESD